FFFFQAEDGIRDSSVTGVQTCALPICARHHAAASLAALRLQARALPRLFQRDRRGDEAAADRARLSGLDPRLVLLGAACRARPQIGRASCRERGENAGGGGAIWNTKRQ